MPATTELMASVTMKGERRNRPTNSPMSRPKPTVTALVPSGSMRARSRLRPERPFDPGFIAPLALFDPRDDAIAVVLDLVEPVVAGRRGDGVGDDDADITGRVAGGGCVRAGGADPCVVD